MPSWQEYKTIARERGALALELYVVESTPNAAPEVLKAQLPAHLDYQQAMEAAGSLVLAGPLSDDSGEQMLGAGLIVYRAKDMQAARQLADADPMHASGARTYRLRSWLVNEGRLDVEMSLSTQTLRIRSGE